MKYLRVSLLLAILVFSFVGVVSADRCSGYGSVDACLNADCLPIYCDAGEHDEFSKCVDPEEMQNNVNSEMSTFSSDMETLASSMDDLGQDYNNIENTVTKEVNDAWGRLNVSRIELPNYYGAITNDKNFKKLVTIIALATGKGHIELDFNPTCMWTTDTGVKCASGFDYDLDVDIDGIIPNPTNFIIDYPEISSYMSRVLNLPDLPYNTWPPYVVIATIPTALPQSKSVSAQDIPYGRVNYPEKWVPDLPTTAQFVTPLCSLSSNIDIANNYVNKYNEYLRQADNFARRYNEFRDILLTWYRSDYTVNDVFTWSGKFGGSGQWTVTISGVGGTLSELIGWKDQKYKDLWKEVTGKSIEDLPEIPRLCDLLKDEVGDKVPDCQIPRLKKLTDVGVSVETGDVTATADLCKVSISGKELKVPNINILLPKKDQCHAAEAASTSSAKKVTGMRTGDTVTIQIPGLPRKPNLPGLPSLPFLPYFAVEGWTFCDYNTGDERTNILDDDIWYVKINISKYGTFVDGRGYDRDETPQAGYASALRMLRVWNNGTVECSNDLGEHYSIDACYEEHFLVKGLSQKDLDAESDPTKYTWLDPINRVYGGVALAEHFGNYTVVDDVYYILGVNDSMGRKYEATGDAGLHDYYTDYVLARKCDVVGVINQSGECKTVALKGRGNLDLSYEENVDRMGYRDCEWMLIDYGKYFNYPGVYLAGSLRKSRLGANMGLLYYLALTGDIRRVTDDLIDDGKTYLKSDLLDWNRDTGERIFGCDDCGRGDLVCSMGSALAGTYRYDKGKECYQSLQKCEEETGNILTGKKKTFEPKYECGYYNVTGNDPNTQNYTGKPSYEFIADSVKSIKTDISGVAISESKWKGPSYRMDWKEDPPKYDMPSEENAYAERYHVTESNINSFIYDGTSEYELNPHGEKVLEIVEVKGVDETGIITDEAHIYAAGKNEYQLFQRAKSILQVKGTYNLDTNYIFAQGQDYELAWNGQYIRWLPGGNHPNPDASDPNFYVTYANVISSVVFDPLRYTLTGNSISWNTPPEQSTEFIVSYKYDVIKLNCSYPEDSKSGSYLGEICPQGVDITTTIIASDHPYTYTEYPGQTDCNGVIRDEWRDRPLDRYDCTRPVHLDTYLPEVLPFDPCTDDFLEKAFDEGEGWFFYWDAFLPCYDYNAKYYRQFNKDSVWAFITGITPELYDQPMEEWYLGKLGEAEGDCDSDSDCKDGLHCSYSDDPDKDHCCPEGKEYNLETKTCEECGVYAYKRNPDYCEKRAKLGVQCKCDEGESHCNPGECKEGLECMPGPEGVGVDGCCKPHDEFWNGYHCVTPTTTITPGKIAEAEPDCHGDNSLCESGLHCSISGGDNPDYCCPGGKEYNLETKTCETCGVYAYKGDKDYCKKKTEHGCACDKGEGSCELATECKSGLECMDGPGISEIDVDGCCSSGEYWNGMHCTSLPQKNENITGWTRTGGGEGGGNIWVHVAAGAQLPNWLEAKGLKEWMYCTNELDRRGCPYTNPQSIWGEVKALPFGKYEHCEDGEASSAATQDDLPKPKRVDNSIMNPGCDPSGGKVICSSKQPMESCGQLCAKFVESWYSYDGYFNLTINEFNESGSVISTSSVGWQVSTGDDIIPKPTSALDELDKLFVNIFHYASIPVTLHDNISSFNITATYTAKNTMRRSAYAERCRWENRQQFNQTRDPQTGQVTAWNTWYQGCWKHLDCRYPAGTEIINDTSTVISNTYGFKIKPEIPLQNSPLLNISINGRADYTKEASTEFNADFELRVEPDILNGFDLLVNNITVYQYITRDYPAMHTLYKLGSTPSTQTIFFDEDIRRELGLKDAETCEYSFNLNNPLEKEYHPLDLYYASYSPIYSWDSYLIPNGVCGEKWKTGFAGVGLFRNYHEDEPNYLDSARFYAMSRFDRSDPQNLALYPSTYHSDLIMYVSYDEEEQVYKVTLHSTTLNHTDIESIVVKVYTHFRNTGDLIKLIGTEDPAPNIHRYIYVRHSTHIEVKIEPSNPVPGNVVTVTPEVIDDFTGGSITDGSVSVICYPPYDGYSTTIKPGESITFVMGQDIPYCTVEYSGYWYSGMTYCKDSASTNEPPPTAGNAGTGTDNVIYNVWGCHAACKSVYPQNYKCTSMMNPNVRWTGFHACKKQDAGAGTCTQTGGTGDEACQNAATTLGKDGTYICCCDVTSGTETTTTAELEAGARGTRALAETTSTTTTTIKPSGTQPSKTSFTVANTSSGAVNWLTNNYILLIIAFLAIMSYKWFTAARMDFEAMLQESGVYDILKDLLGKK